MYAVVTLEQALDELFQQKNVNDFAGSLRIISGHAMENA